MARSEQTAHQRVDLPARYRRTSGGPASFLFFFSAAQPNTDTDKSISTRAARRFHVFLLQPGDLALSGSLTLRRLRCLIKLQPPEISAAAVNI